MFARMIRQLDDWSQSQRGSDLWTMISWIMEVDIDWWFMVVLMILSRVYPSETCQLGTSRSIPLKWDRPPTHPHAFESMQSNCTKQHSKGPSRTHSPRRQNCTEKRPLTVATVSSAFFVPNAIRKTRANIKLESKTHSPSFLRLVLFELESLAPFGLLNAPVVLPDLRLTRRPADAVVSFGGALAKLRWSEVVSIAFNNSWGSVRRPNCIWLVVVMSMLLTNEDGLLEMAAGEMATSMDDVVVVVVVVDADASVQHEYMHM